MLLGFMIGMGMNTAAHWLTWLVALPGAVLGARYLWSPIVIGCCAAIGFQFLEDIPMGRGGEPIVLLVRFLPAFLVSGAIILAARLAAKRIKA